MFVSIPDSRTPLFASPRNPLLLADRWRSLAVLLLAVTLSLSARVPGGGAADARNSPARPDRSGTGPALARNTDSDIEGETDSGHGALADGPRISGAFFQLWESDRERPSTYWEKELSLMQAIGLDLVIIQSNQPDGANFSDITEKILLAADGLGMRVFIGTALNEKGWYTNKASATFLAAEAKSIASYTKAMVGQFKPHRSFKGVYLPYEDNGLYPWTREAMGDFYGMISQAARGEKPDLKVMISPYTALIPSLDIPRPTGWTEWHFTGVLQRAGVDICAWQDGVGCSPSRIDDVEAELAAMVRACRAANVECWGNVEIFHTENGQTDPTSIDMLKLQLKRESHLVETFICFDFNHYMSPQNGNPKAARLYEEYRGLVTDSRTGLGF